MTINIQENELFFIPLGGVGEIGMNLAVYGYGTAEDMHYLVVDMGVSFADEDFPGADLIMPDISFLEEQAMNIDGLIITHGHEDHYGAVAELWPKLQVPIYCTEFTHQLLASKFERDDFEDLPITLFRPGDKFKVGPFVIDTVTVNHSIPESVSLAIKTDLGTVLHTGDWKIDPFPILGDKTDENKFCKLGKEGVLALICDSTNAMSEGTNDSEIIVRETLSGIMQRAKSRVAITSFSSNIGRIKSIVEAAKENGRKVLLMGRSLKKSTNIALELGYLDNADDFITEEEFHSTSPDKIVLVLTGSQGEVRAALSKIAFSQLNNIQLSPGDIVIYSSRMIPGNEKRIAKVQNALVDQGLEVITYLDENVHVSGHAKRNDLRKMYEWTQPEIVIPVHGQPMHLESHAKLAKSCGVPQTIRVKDGDIVRLAPGVPSIVDKAPVDLLFKDGKILGNEIDLGINARRKLSRVGHVTVAIILKKNGELLDAPRVVMCGVPYYTNDDEEIYKIVRDRLQDYIDGLPPKVTKNRQALQEGCSRIISQVFLEEWGKKPLSSIIVHYTR